MKNKTLITASFIFLGFVADSEPVSAEKTQGEIFKSIDTEAGRKLVDSLGREAIGVLTNNKTTTEVRETKFRELLHRGFDFKSIAKFVLGRYWRTGTDAEKKEYTDLFETMIVQAYSDRFKDYNNEEFLVKSVRSDEGGGMTVLSEIVRPSGPSIKVEWKIFPAKDTNTPKIFDVKVDGVSMSVTQRSEFASIIQREGGTISGLNKVLKERTSR
jgi:phospholipid transport system substrate-binding protein